MVTLSTEIEDLPDERLDGFFEGWPTRLAGAELKRVLLNSHRAIVAMDGEQVVGFINAISDGVMAGFIPMLEVRPDWQDRGIGSLLLSEMLGELSDLYSVDLTCDPGLVGYYEPRGFTQISGMGLRNPQALQRLAGGG